MLLAAFGARATRLSYRAGLRRAASRLFQALARVSLLAGLLSVPTACLIEDPPPYTQPGRTRPRLDLVAATPALDDVIVRNGGDSVQFSVPVVSEDAGDRPRGFLLMDYFHEACSRCIVNTADIPASTLDDTNRRITMSWFVDSTISSGCHRLTLRVSHSSNFTNGPEVVDEEDVAEAYWWANINPQLEGNTLVNCPVASSGP